jgi:hypothetical protein
MSEIKRKDCKSLDEYALKKTEIFHRRKDANKPISTLEQVQQLLKGLDSKYTPFKTVVCNSAATETVDMLVTKLQNHEIGTLQLKEDESEEVTASFTLPTCHG